MKTCVFLALLMCFVFINSHNYYARHIYFINEKMRLWVLQTCTTFPTHSYNHLACDLSSPLKLLLLRLQMIFQVLNHFSMINSMTYSSALLLNDHAILHHFQDHSLFQKHLSDLFPPSVSPYLFFLVLVLRCGSS